VTVDARLTPSGRSLVNLLDPAEHLVVEEHGQRHVVRVPLNSHQIGIYTLGQG